MTKAARTLLTTALLLGLVACGPPETRKAGERVEPLKNYEQVVEQYTSALQDNPDSVVLLTELGIAQYNLGRYDAAMKNFGHAMAVQDYPKAAFYYGLTHIANGKRTAGLEMLTMFRYTGKLAVTKSIRAEATELLRTPEVSDQEAAARLYRAWETGLRNPVEPDGANGA